ncbi:MAG: AzlD domain-containing protein [Euzebya sp.]
MSTTAWIVAIVGGLATFAERWSFLAFADRAARVPPRLREALRMIPAAALAALVAPAVLRSGTDGALALTDPRILAAIAALLTMWRTRQVLLTLLVGMGVLIGLQQL